MADTKEQVAQRLENFVRKVKVLSQGTSEVDCRVHAPHVQGHPYVIEIVCERFVRRVDVDVKTVQRLNLGQPDPLLMRDVRTAILAVTRLAQRRS